MQSSHFPQDTTVVRKPFLILVALYLLAIVLANLSIAHFGPSASIFNAFLLIGLNLATRDKLHDLWGKNIATNMFFLISAGGMISYLMNAGAGRIALASVAAFALSEAVDAAVYHLRRHRPYLIRSNTSNIFGAAVDSIIFPMLAFGGFPILIILGQFAAKVAGGAMWSYILHRTGHGQPHTATTG